MANGSVTGRAAEVGTTMLDELHQQIKETPVINYRAAKRIITGCQDYNPPLKDYNALYYRTSFEILVGG